MIVDTDHVRIIDLPHRVAGQMNFADSLGG
jgi:hypothetical protein